MMAKIRGKNTSPEIAVRKLLHSLGYRFRLHRKDLPGKPDIVLPRYKAVILVHGCFWHRHKECKYAYSPKSNVEFWQKKFDANLARDAKVEAQLLDAGWRYCIIWECEVSNLDVLREKLVAFLSH